jgi:beta-barrel assembly-enhancing protease
MFRKRGITLFVSFLLLVLVLGGVIGKSWGLTVDEEKKLGRRILLEMERKAEFIRDPTLQVYVNYIGQSIVKEVGPTPFEFKFYLLKGAEPNAFAIPGGYIFLTSGLIILAESENELAGVVSHEVAHVTGRHISHLIDRSKRLNIASLGAMLAGVLMGGRGGDAVATTALAGSEALTLKYTRENETDADQNGIHFLAKAGYDPEGMITFLNKIYRMSLISSSKIPAYLSTHPAVENRISFLENVLLTGTKPQGPYKATGLFKRVQTKVFVEEKEPQAAVAYFESILKTNPQDGDALYGLGLSYQKMGRLDKAAEVFRSAEATVPGAPDFLRELGVVYFLSGKMDLSIETLEKLRTVRQNDPLGNYYLAKGYQEKGLPDRALILFSQVYKQIPDWPEVSLSLGSVYGRLGKKGLSHFYFGKYFALKGEENTALLHFRTALESMEKGSPEREQAQMEIKEYTSDRK